MKKNSTSNVGRRGEQCNPIHFCCYGFEGNKYFPVAKYIY